MAYLGQIPAIIDAGSIDAPSTSTVQNSTLMTLGSVSGTNVITAATTPAISAYVVGQTFRFTSVGENTGAVTINISGLGAKSITKSGAAPLVAGDIPSGAVVQITYDGTQFQMVSGAGAAGGGGGAVADGTMYEAGTDVANNYTITAGKNALAIDKLSVASGKSVTIPSGSKLVVLGAGGQTGTPDQYVGVSGNQNVGGVKNFTSAPTLNGADLTSIGVGQTWQNVSGSRAVSTTYTNTTGRPIQVSVAGFYSITTGAQTSLLVNGNIVALTQGSGGQTISSGWSQLTAIVPNGATYSVTGSLHATNPWWELR